MGNIHGDNILNKNNIVLKFLSDKKILSFDDVNGTILVSDPVH